MRTMLFAAVVVLAGGAAIVVAVAAPASGWVIRSAAEAGVLAQLARSPYHHKACWWQHGHRICP
jgi:hypothetical protein